LTEHKFKLTIFR